MSHDKKIARVSRKPVSVFRPALRRLHRLRIG